jgi:hypothetical protein
LKKSSRKKQAYVGQCLTEGTKVDILRPNLWWGRKGVVKSCKDGIHIIRVMSVSGDFDGLAKFEELKAEPTSCKN